MKLSPKQLNEFRRNLLAWYRANLRDLPWRATTQSNVSEPNCPKAVSSRGRASDRGICCSQGVPQSAVSFPAANSNRAQRTDPRIARTLADVIPRSPPALNGVREGQDDEESAVSFRSAKPVHDPYRVWLSEVMLQQTRIAAVIPYYTTFLERFPSVEALARGREHDVLRYWAGLGYYSRARNLHRAAREIVANHNGEFPRDRDAALALPGIGHYTAAAVLSICYNAPLAVLDGNVARVLARLGAVCGDLRAPKTWARLAAGAQQMLAPDSPGDWNQALMELGETICTPLSPNCNECPVAKFCRARALQLTDRIPAPRRKPRTVAIKIAAAVLVDKRGRTLLVREPGAHDQVLFSRMWQFPAIEVKRDAPRELKQHLASSLGLRTNGVRELPPAKHAVTFRSITLIPFLIRVEQLPAAERSRPIALHNLATLPISSATQKIAASALQSLRGNISTKC